MITFIPSWNNATITDISSDDLISQIKSFMNDDEQYQILTSNYMPFLRYFLHRYELFESNYWNAFDELQGVKKITNQKRIDFSDFNFGEGITYFYTPFLISIYKHNDRFAEIEIKNGGQVYSVAYFDKDGNIKSKDIYDDRGFISSYEVYKNKKLDHLMYLDIKGNWIFKRSAINGKIFVNPENRHGLKQSSYSNMDEIQNELLLKKLKKISSNDSIVFSVTDDNYQFIENNKFLGQMTLSFFSNRFSFNNMSVSFQKSLQKSNACIVDTEKNYENVKRIGISEKHINLLSPFDTRFEFGISQTMKEEIIFFDGRFLSEEILKKNAKELLNYIYEKQSNSENTRDIRVIIRCLSNYEGTVEKIFRDAVQEKFPDDYKLIGEMLQDDGDENSIDDETLITDEFEAKLKTASSISIKVINRDEELFETLNISRLIIDISENPDIFTQIAAISAGIPQINISYTEYVQNKKNGVVLSSNEELRQGLEYYLDTLKHWTEAQAYSAKQIQKYSGNSLKEYLLTITGEQSHG